jgi:BirA family transcriptional regulator, biotin operon repressor / biotin---[acetyl-CoA-carboxylase] ligase
MTSSVPFTPSRNVHLETIDSTNAEGLRRAADGERGPLWITAAVQTAGRGRSGRPWSAPVGNFAGTMLFEPGCEMVDLHQLGFVAGVAVHEAIIQSTGSSLTGLRLKWPNDILVGGAKAGGILVETSTFGRDVVAAIGIGLNIAIAPAIEGRTVTALGAHAPHLDASALYTEIDRAMRYWLAVWQAGVGFGHVRSAWTARSGAPGEAIAVNAGPEHIMGTYLGLDDSGALLLREPSGSIRRLTYGDVSLTGASGHP